MLRTTVRATCVRSASSHDLINECQTAKGSRSWPIAVVIPGRFGELLHSPQIYARRRLMVLLFLAAIVLVLLVGTGHVVANRGGAPASASMIRPANPAAAAHPAAANMYIVQAGDTLWSIGQRFHGDRSLADYVDRLIADKRRYRDTGLASSLASITSTSLWRQCGARDARPTTPR